MKASFIVSFVFLSLVCAGTLFAQQHDPNTLRALPVNTKISLDGKLSEPAWSQAMHISNFVQRELNEGAPATERTEVAVLYDEKSLYRILGFDSRPGQITATQMERDFNWPSDDNFEVILDTYNDNRNGYLFVTNPNGARADALVIDNGSQFNKDWDGIWEVKTTRNDQGWFAEIRIPLSTLKFRSSDEQEWGINFERNIRRKREQVLWQGWSRDADLEQVNRAGTLVNLQNLESRNLIDVRPYGIVGLEDGRDQKTVVTGDLGVSASYLVTPSLKLDVTANPDFAQAEADRAQVNLTRFSLLFPEKRSFFLEGREFFEFDMGGLIRPFFSRRIGLNQDRESVPIYGGGRFYGKQGNTTLGAMSLQTAGSAGSGTTNFTTMRIKQDIFDQSTIGLLSTSKVQSGRMNSTNGLDFRYSTSSLFGDKNFNAGASAVQSYTSDASDQNGFGHYVFMNYPNDLAEIGASWERAGADFNPEVGFLEREAYQMLYTEIQFNPRPSFIPWMQQAQIKPVDINYFWDDRTGKLQTLKMEFRPLGFGTTSGEFIEFNIFRFGERLSDPFEISEGVTVPVDTYWFTRYEVKGFTYQARPLSLEYGVTWGDFLDGSRNSYEGELTWRTGKYLSLSADYDYHTFDLANGSFDVHEIGGRASFAFTPELFGSLFGQWNSETEEILVNFRVNWIPAPGTDLFFVVNQAVETQNQRWNPSHTSVLTKLVWRFAL